MRRMVDTQVVTIYARLPSKVFSLDVDMRRLHVRNAAIMTVDEEAEIEMPEDVVRVVPAWKWLLAKSFCVSPRLDGALWHNGS